MDDVIIFHDTNTLDVRYNTHIIIIMFTHAFSVTKLLCIYCLTPVGFIYIYIFFTQLFPIIYLCTYMRCLSSMKSNKVRDGGHANTPNRLFHFRGTFKMETIKRL